MNNLVSQLLQSHFKGAIATILDSTDLEEQEIVSCREYFHWHGLELLVKWRL